MEYYYVNLHILPKICICSSTTWKTSHDSIAKLLMHFWKMRLVQFILKKYSVYIYGNMAKHNHCYMLHVDQHYAIIICLD